jgi:hypothetical protein
VSRAFAITALSLLKTDYAAISAFMAFLLALTMPSGTLSV